jgi:hypothetical protein
MARGLSTRHAIAESMQVFCALLAMVTVGYHRLFRWSAQGEVKRTAAQTRCTATDVRTRISL